MAKSGGVIAKILSLSLGEGAAQEKAPWYPAPQPMIRGSFHSTCIGSQKSRSLASINPKTL